MERRDFFKSLGLVGSLSLAGLYSNRAAWCDTRPHHTDALPRDNKDTGENLGGPFDIAVGEQGRLLITDSPRYRVTCFDPLTGIVSSFGKPGSIVGRLNYPRGIAVGPDGLIYVADANNCRIQVFDANGNVKRVVGSIGSIAGCFSTPQGIHVDAKTRLLVADTRNHRIQIFENFELVAVVGELGDSDDQFRLPTACVTRGDELLVLDSKHGMVKVFGPDLEYRFSFGGAGMGPGQLNMPQGIEVAPDGTVWIADTGNNRLQFFSAEGKLQSLMGKVGSELGQFRSPTGLAWYDGCLYIADSGNRRIQMFRDHAFERLVL